MLHITHRGYRFNRIPISAEFKLPIEGVSISEFREEVCLFAGGGLEVAGQQVEQGALPGAVGPDDRHSRAHIHAEVHVAQPEVLRSAERGDRNADDGKVFV